MTLSDMIAGGGEDTAYGSVVAEPVTLRAAFERLVMADLDIDLSWGVVEWRVLASQPHEGRAHRGVRGGDTPVRAGEVVTLDLGRGVSVRGMVVASAIAGQWARAVIPPAKLAAAMGL